MNTFQCRNYAYLFMGFTVEPFDECKNTFYSYKKYKITGVRIYRIVDGCVINESIKYFLEHLDYIRHTMRLSKVGNSNFNRINEALAYLLTTHKYIVFINDSGRVALSTDTSINYTIKDVIAVTKRKIYGIGEFIGYYSKKHRLLYEVDTLKMKWIKAKEMPIEVYEFFKTRNFFKTLDSRYCG